MIWMIADLWIATPPTHNRGRFFAVRGCRIDHRGQPLMRTTDLASCAPLLAPERRALPRKAEEPLG